MYKMFIVCFEADEVNENETLSDMLERVDNGDAELIDAEQIDMGDADNTRISSRDIEKVFA
jgi:hypothetical protein